MNRSHNVVVLLHWFHRWK